MEGVKTWTNVWLGFERNITVLNVLIRWKAITALKLASVFWMFITVIYVTGVPIKGIPENALVFV